MKTGYYAVARGHCTGVYKTWSECEKNVKGYRNARYKKFAKESDALAFILQNSNIGHGRNGKSSKSALPSTSGNGKSSKSALPSTAGNGKSSKSAIPSTTKVRELPCSESASHKQNKWEGVPVVYTDGACSSNGHAGATAGIGVYWGEEHINNISEPLLDGPATNNRAELTAVIRAIQMATQQKYQRLIVRTDSNLLIQTMNSWIHRWRKNGWKTSNGTAVKNQDLIIQLSNLLHNIDVRFEHVAGHAGILGNEKADQLAREGAIRYRQMM